MSDVFLFNISKCEYMKIFEEIVNIEKWEWQSVLNLYRHEKLENKHTFIYVHDFDTIFVNWDEILIDDEDENE